MIISAEEYNKRINETETITLPGGAEFELRKNVNARKLAVKFLPLINDISKNADEKNAARISKMTDEQIDQSIMMDDFMLIAAVENPKLSLVREAGKVCIDDIPNLDYKFLIEKMTEISYGGNVVNPLSEQDKQQDLTS